MKNNEKETSVAKGWLESICDRTKYSRKDIQAFIKKYKIPQTPGIGNPKRIHITSISFSGTKQGKYTDDFRFIFDSLKPGIWGLFSDGNGKGKTSALEVIKWLFKGRVSDGLQSGVKSWIKDAELMFNIDDSVYSISVQQKDEIFYGEIKRAPIGKDLQPFREFNSEEEMSTTISEFMLEQLDLGQIASFRHGENELETGREVVHGWPALASAMFIGTSYGAIFGDHATSGLPNRILNMYMGLPWIPTYAALKALNGQLKSNASVEELHLDRATQTRKKRLEDIREALKTKEDLFARLAPPKSSKTEYHKLIEHYNKTYAQSNDAYKRLADAKLEMLEVEKAYQTDRIKLNNFKEDRAANKIFKQLNPTCCPHCEQKVSAKQIEKERLEHTCAICDKTMLDGDDSEEILAELQQNSEATRQAFQNLKDSIKIRQKVFDNFTSMLLEQDGDIKKYKQELDLEQSRDSEYRNLQNEISTLKILEEEYKDNDKKEPSLLSDSLHKTDEPTEDTLDENKILSAALKETESRFKGLQEDLLAEVNKKMMEYCPKVGLTQYADLTLNSQPSLKIIKDGSETSFSKVSKGEQLRLKVLATIALISVAEERKLGRHPGFLIIDSPASQEVNKDDLNNMIAGLEDLCETLPSLQIIVASVANDTLLSHIDVNHRKYAKETEFLW